MLHSYFLFLTHIGHQQLVIGDTTTTTRVSSITGSPTVLRIARANGANIAIEKPPCGQPLPYTACRATAAL